MADLCNFIPLGSLVCQPIGDASEGRYTPEFQESNHLPASVILISAQHHIRTLCGKHWIRIFIRKQQDGTIHTRVYVLPDDVGRRFIQKEDRFLRLRLVELIRQLDNSQEAWSGCKSDRKSSYELGSGDDDSLFYIFNRLPSPNSDGLAVSCPYSSNAIQDVFEPTALRGLKTQLYPYQKRTIATMIKREVQPARTLDPRLQPLAGPTATVFYLNTEAGSIFREKREYDEACGGILGESMGLGKTLICLTTILATKGHWPLIPPEYSLGLHPIRPQVASLMQTAAAAVAQARIPWKSVFQEMLTSGDDQANCRALLEENIPSYVIPATASSRATRRPITASKGKLIKLCSATLVIVPQNLVSQWKGEILRHIDETELNVLCLDTVGDVSMPSAEQLQRYDIILLPRQRLERELVPTENAKHLSNGRCSCPLDHECMCSTKDGAHSPLKDLHFLRVIMDEGHEFSSYGSRNKTYWALQQLHVDRKWIVSGTPTSGLMGVEVGAAASETADAAGTNFNESNAEILQRRRKEMAWSQERKDLEKLGGLVVGVLKLKPWANKGADYAMWSRHIMPAAQGARRPTSLQQLLQSLVVRHRIEDIEADLELPPLYNRVVHLRPSWYDKVSINLFALALVANFVTSERTDEDYMFHEKNRRFLNSLITNLRQANFYWTSWTPEQVTKTIQASRSYLEDHSLPNSNCSKNDRCLLERGINLGEIILQCKPWQSLTQVHEMGIFVENFPEEAQHAWTLTEREGTEPLISGATQMIKAQEWVDAHMNIKNMKEMAHALSGIGTKVMRKLWVQEEETPEDRSLAQDQTNTRRRKERPVGPSGVPKLTQKQTVSRVKAVPILKKSNGIRLMQKPRPADIVPEGDDAASQFPSGSPPMPPPLPILPSDSPLANTKIIGTASTKLSYLLDQLTCLHITEKILVFYEGDHIAYYIAQALELLSIRHLIYTGTLSPARQSAYVTTFNTTQTFRVLLMDVHQAAHGLHIASASRVFFVNPVWQPHVEAQAIKRAHRIGQTKPVYVETLVLEGTLEDQMLQRRKGMTAQEHQKAEKSLLDDDTMSTIIKDSSFIPLCKEEIQNVRHQIAQLQMPQRLFGRPDRPMGDVSDPDADLIFPEGTPKKSRKRKFSSEHTPDLTDFSLSAQRVIPGPTAPAVSPFPPLAQSTSISDSSMGVPHSNGILSVPGSLSNSLPVRRVESAVDEPETTSPSGLFGGPMSVL